MQNSVLTVLNVRTVHCDEIGVKVTKQEFVDFLNSVKGGQYFHIRGYTNADGEKADHWLRFGIKYENLKNRDIDLLKSVLADEKSFSVVVTHGVWVPDEILSNGTVFNSQTGSNMIWATVSRTVQLNGVPVKVDSEGFIDLMDTVTFSNRKALGRSPVTLSYVMSSLHPLVIAAIGAADLQGTVLQGLERPRESSVEYDKQATSCYSLEKEGQPSKWYLRDVMAVSKVVRVQGDYPFKASFPINAIKDAIRSKVLLTGKYRQFILTDGQFDTVTIEGQAVLCDGMEEEFYFADPKVVKEFLQSEVVQ